MILRSLVPLLLFTISSVSCQVEVPDPVWYEQNGGLRVEVPGIAGLSEVQLHFSLNKPVVGVQNGDYNIVINSGSDMWVYEDPEITVKVGDTINYWILVFVNGPGYQKTDQSQTVQSKTPPTTTTEEPTTTRTTTTVTTTTTTVTTTTTQPPLPTPTLHQIEGGFKIQLEDFEGLEHVSYHISVNTPINGIDYGDVNVDLEKPNGAGFWRYSWKERDLEDGDTVYYWYYIVVDHHGLQFTDLHWTVGETTPAFTTTTTPAGTTIPSILSVTESNIGPYFTPGQLIFEDNFDFFDEDTWQNEITLGGGGNWEFQMYTHNRSNSYTRDGNLYLKPTLTTDCYGEEWVTSQIMDVFSGQPGSECTSNAFYGCFRVGSPSNIINPIMSARLRSSISFSFLYGKVEVSAKLPVGDWLWPAIWLLPQKSKYGQWPASGEIDIMESRGNTQLTMEGEDIGVNQFGSTLQFGGGYPLNGWEKAHCVYNLPGGKGFHEDFHTFGLDWTPTYLAFSIDGEEYCKVEPPEGGFWELGEWQDTEMLNPWQWGRNQRMAPFDEQYFLVMNVAVGGTGGYFPDEAANGNGKPWNNESPQAMTDFWNQKGNWLPTWNMEEDNGEGAAMVVDYVRVWASDVVKEN